MIKTLFRMAVLKVRMLWLSNQMKGKPVQCAVFECTDRALFQVDYRSATWDTGEDLFHADTHRMPVCGTHRTTWPYRWATVVRTSRLED